jgi:hypothetical protein
VVVSACAQDKLGEQLFFIELFRQLLNVSLAIQVIVVIQVVVLNIVKVFFTIVLILQWNLVRQWGAAAT